jgi:hypothetical protein
LKVEETPSELGSGGVSCLGDVAVFRVKIRT